MVEIHPQQITGNWKSGVALDFHTTRAFSTFYESKGFPSARE
jgi:hypothetical protein